MLEQNSPFISVIMAVYNTEKYLSTSIDSLIFQKFNNWELICVDDGSTDNSLNLLRSYELKDSRIKVISQNHYGTASKARNTALKYVKGKYVAMLDSDDKYDENTLLLTFNRIKETESDMILFNICFCNEDLSIINKELKGLNGDLTKVINGKNAFIESLNWNIGGCGAFKTEIIKEHKYCEDGINGDELSTRIFFLNSKSIAFSEGKYYYRILNNSSSRQIAEKFYYKLDTELSLLKILEKHSYFKNLVASFQKRYLMKLFNSKIHYLNNKNLLKKNEAQRVSKYFKLHFENAKKLNFLKMKEVFNSFINYLMFRFIFSKYIFFKFSCYLISFKSKIKRILHNLSDFSS